MLEIDGKIVSLDILTECFMCDLSKCKGMCCVEGNAGAPLEMGESDILAREFENYFSYLKPEGIEEITKSGFAVTDSDGDLTTPLIDTMECAYSFDENGMTLCAVERAWKEGKTSFRKPVSCHLYPIRITKFNNGTVGLNYHRWSVCVPAVKNGVRSGIPVYKSLREPIISYFGEEFYQALEAAAEYIHEKSTRLAE